MCDCKDDVTCKGHDVWCPLYRDAGTSQECRSKFKILRTRRVTWSKVLTEGPQVLGASVECSFARETWWRGFLYRCMCVWHTEVYALFDRATWHVTVKVKLTLEQAMKVQSGSMRMAVLFFNLGARGGVGVVNATPRPLYPRERDSEPIV